MFDKIAEKIDVLSDHTLAIIHICGGFNLHHKEWLVHSKITDKEGRYSRDISIAYKLTQIVDKPSRIPKTRHCTNIFLTSCSEKCSAKVLPLLGTADHSLVSVKIDAKSKVTEQFFSRLTGTPSDLTC